MPTIDNMQIDINAQVAKANDAIDRLVLKLDRLTNSLSKVEESKITGLANGVQKLSNAMQSMNTIKTSDFTRLASNLTKISNINVSSLNSAASSMSHLTRAFNGLGTVSANAQSVGDLAKNISRLGNKSVQNAITNIPQLSSALNGLMTTLSKSPKVSRNIIDMTNSLANLSTQGSKVGSASRSIVRGLNNSSNAAERSKKSFGGLAATFGKFYATYFLVIRGIKGLFNSIGETADYIEAFNYFNVALDKVGKDWGSQYDKYGYKNAESYADSFEKRLSASIKDLSGLTVEIGADGKGLLTESGAKNLGLNIREITQYASQLASVTNSVGQTGEVSLAASKAFTKLAGDMSSLFNVDYSSVAKNLQSGLIGQSRALYKYGIDITNATLQTYAYEMGLSKAVMEMTQAEKMQLRMIAILDQSKVSWGDLANTINSPSNMLRQFTNNLKETSMVLGQLFIPVLQKVMPVINGVVIAVKRLLVGIARLMGIKLDLESFGQGAPEIEEGFGDISDSLDDVANSAKKAKAGLRSFDELKVISMPDSSSAGAGGGGGGTIDLTDEILKATAEYEKAWQEAFDKMENKANEWADKISKLLEPVMKIFQDFAVGDFFQAGQDVSNLVVSITDFFARAIDSVDWEGIGTKIGDFMSGINWTEILSSVGDLIWQAIKAAIELWKGSFDAAPIETGILTAISLLKWTRLGDVLWESMKRGLLLSISTKIGGFIARELPKFVTKAGTLLSMLSPGMVGELGNLIEDSVIGDIFDTSKWTGLPKAIDDFLWEIAYIIGDVVEDIVIWIGTGITDIFKKLFNFDEAGKWFGKSGEWFSKIKEDFENKDWCAIGEDILWGILDGLTGALVGVVEPFTDLLQWTWDSICDVFGIHSPAESMEPLGENILLGIIEGFTSKFTEFTDSITDWYENYVKPWFSSEKWNFTGIQDGLSKAWQAGINAIKELWNTFANWLNEKLTWTIDPIVILGKTIFDGTTIKLGKIPTFDVSTYSAGGFPEDGWFRASKGEYFGKFDDGTSYIANNRQVTTSLSGSLYPAIYNAVRDAMEGGNGSGNPEPIIKVYIGDKEIKEVAIKGINEDYRRGLQPLMI